jgi:hypothetical protein
LKRFIGVCRAAVILFVVGLSACGGGNGDRLTNVEVTIQSLSFSAASPDAQTPPTQSLTATFGPGTVYVTILHSGAAIAGVTYTITGNTAQIVVSPASPGTLGAGNFTGAVTVTAYDCGNPDCSTLVPGNTQIVKVTFGIPPIVRFVAPYVGITGLSDKAIIRGQGFQAFTVQGVTFGGVAATEFTVVSDTEITATYPALSAGTQAVLIDAPTSPGAIVTSANLAVVDAPSFAATTLAYPSASPQVLKLLYDAERQALLLAVTDTVLGGEVLRYAFTGGAWGSPATAVIGDLGDIALSTNGTELLALSQTALTHTDPVSLAAGTVTPGPTLAVDTFLKNLAVANDDTAVVTTGFNGSGNSPLYLYSTRNPAFTQPSPALSLNNAIARAAANGTLIGIVQGDPTLTTDPSVYQFSASTNLFTATIVALNQNTVAPVLDRAATRLVLNGTNVYDTSFVLLGTLPATTLAVVIKPDATRAYTFDSTASEVLSFDLTASPGGGVFPQVGTGTTLAGDPGSGAQMAISADGGTLFLAGGNQIVVQPSPP